MADNTNKEMSIPPELLRPTEPVKIFDELYFIGNKMVGSWVIQTNEGLVLIEGSAETDHWENCLQPGLKKLGLEKEKILALLLTHGHMDHYAGCAHIQKATGCDVCISLEDLAYMTCGVENQKPNETLELPKVTRILKKEEQLVFGNQTIQVLYAPGHTPGCLNFSMEVHDNGERHRFVMMGGYGLFGPGCFMGQPYPYGIDYSVENALLFADSCSKLWQYAQNNHCDVFFNPHPHLCDLYEHAQENENRKPGEKNAFVIGQEGVRKWIVERFEACLKAAWKFSTLDQEYKE